MNILIKLYPGYGVGDAVQMSSVLRHVVEAHPDWKIDYGAEEGKHQAGRGIVTNTFALGRSTPSEKYDAEIEIVLYDTYMAWTDRPNTRVTSCLHSQFGLPWKSEYARYEINVSGDVNQQMEVAIRKFLAGGVYRQRPFKKPVALHYRGDSAPLKKDLSDNQADQICDFILARDRTPLIIDWRNTSPVSNRIDVCTTGRELFSREYGRNLERNTALIAQCEAFIGIDSGPAKCASATNTPALVIWTGHHPAVFHDPSPNTTHLVPNGYGMKSPVFGNIDVMNWFEDHYQYRVYETDPIAQIKRWLEEVLKK